MKKKKKQARKSRVPEKKPSETEEKDRERVMQQLRALGYM